MINNLDLFRHPYGIPQDQVKEAKKDKPKINILDFMEMIDSTKSNNGGNKKGSRR